jgi:hypothetical protein
MQIALARARDYYHTSRSSRRRVISFSAGRTSALVLLSFKSTATEFHRETVFSFLSIPESEADKKFIT